MVPVGVPRVPLVGALGAALQVTGLQVGAVPHEPSAAQVNVAEPARV